MPYGHCKAHRGQKDKARGTRQQRGYTDAWLALSRDRLARHPWCVGYPKGCHEQRTLADVTDHIESARNRPDLFWEPSNHQSLCHACHGRKTTDEDGAFGR